MTTALLPADELAALPLRAQPQYAALPDADLVQTGADALEGVGRAMWEVVDVLVALAARVAPHERTARLREVGREWSMAPKYLERWLRIGVVVPPGPRREALGPLFFTTVDRAVHSTARRGEAFLSPERQERIAHTLTVATEGVELPIASADGTTETRFVPGPLSSRQVELYAGLQRRDDEAHRLPDDLPPMEPVPSDEPLPSEPFGDPVAALLDGVRGDLRREEPGTWPEVEAVVLACARRNWNALTATGWVFVRRAA